MKFDSVRSFKKILPLCIIFILLNLVYLGRHTSSRFITGVPKHKLYQVYHKDEKNHLLVLQPIINDDIHHVNHLINNNINDIDHSFNYFDVGIIAASDLGSYSQYNIVYVNDYDFENITNFNDISDPLINDLAKMQYYSEFKSTFNSFFTDLFDIIADTLPSVPSIQNDDHYRLAREENKFPNRDGRIPVYGGHLRENYLAEGIRTVEMLSNFLRLDEDEVTSLKGSHNKFMSNFVDKYPEELFKFNQFNQFMKGNGIVYLGGDEYNQLALLSIKMLRSTGSKLPIELIIPNEGDYDIELCNSILPNLNANCKVMSHYLPKPLMENVKGYQLKNLALLISSFKNVLYLDADNIPLKNPDYLFVNEPFISNHLVLWPDLWRRSTSPNFYRIADIETSPQERVRNSYFKNDKRGEKKDEISFHDTKGTIPEASSETGQIIINKEVHFKTLILSMYYNYHGPHYYYPLLSQGAAGEGDKETFIAAAHKLGLPYYQVKEFVREFGPLNNNKKHEFFAMGQYDPLIDYVQDTHPDVCLSRADPDYAVNSDDKEHSNYNFHYFKSSNLMFLHANWPKYKLSEMFIHNSHGRGPKSGENRRRLYGLNIMDETFGADVELLIMESVHWLYCDSDINIKRVAEIGSEDRQKICNEVKEQVSFLSTKV